MFLTVRRKVYVEREVEMRAREGLVSTGREQGCQSVRMVTLLASKTLERSGLEGRV